MVRSDEGKRKRVIELVALGALSSWDLLAQHFSEAVRKWSVMLKIALTLVSSHCGKQQLMLYCAGYKSNYV